MGTEEVKAGPGAILRDGQPALGTATQPRPSVGRIVHYVMADKTVRPAIVVKVNNPADYLDDSVNLQVFTDGANDDELLKAAEQSAQTDIGAPPKPTDRIVWRSHVGYRSDRGVAGTWHWPLGATASRSRLVVEQLCGHGVALTQPCRACQVAPGGFVPAAVE